MKNKFNAIIAISALVIGANAFAQADNTLRSPKELGIEISKLIKTFGPFSKKELPDPDDPSPWGQVFYWEKPQSLQIHVLTDNYEPKYNGKGKVVSLTIDGGKTNKTYSVDSITVINETTVNQFIQSREKFQKSQFFGTQCQKGKRNDVTFKVENNDESFIFYHFNSNRLCAVTWSQINFDMVD